MHPSRRLSPGDPTIAVATSHQVTTEWPTTSHCPKGATRVAQASKSTDKVVVVVAVIEASPAKAHITVAIPSMSPLRHHSTFIRRWWSRGRRDDGRKDEEQARSDKRLHGNLSNASSGIGITGI
jgi:hypothetical protein